MKKAIKERTDIEKKQRRKKMITLHGRKKKNKLPREYITSHFKIAIDVNWQCFYLKEILCLEGFRFRVESIFFE